jgi:hypothetical protein
LSGSLHARKSKKQKQRFPVKQSSKLDILSGAQKFAPGVEFREHRLYESFSGIWWRACDEDSLAITFAIPPTERVLVPDKEITMTTD